MALLWIWKKKGLYRCHPATFNSQHLSGTPDQDLTQKAPYNQPLHWETRPSLSP